MKVLNLLKVLRLFVLRYPTKAVGFIVNDNLISVNYLRNVILYVFEL